MKHRHKWLAIDRRFPVWGFRCLCGAVKSGITGKVYPRVNEIKGTRRTDAFLNAHYPGAQAAPWIAFVRRLELELNEVTHDFRVARQMTAEDVANEAALLKQLKRKGL